MSTTADMVGGGVVGVGLVLIITAVWLIAARIEQARAARWARIVAVVDESADVVRAELDRAVDEGMRRLDPRWRGSAVDGGHPGEVFPDDR